MQATRGTPLSDPPEPDGDREVALGRRRIGVLAVAAAFALVADVVTKVIAVATLSDRPPLRVIDGWLELTETRNPGAAFSIGTGATFVFTAVAVGVVVVIIRTARRLHNVPWAIAFGLLLGGALGNLTDRVFRDPGPLRGHVVDWIRLPHWPVFNLADSAIVVGALLAVLLSMRGIGLDGSREHADAPEADG